MAPRAPGWDYRVSQNVIKINIFSDKSQGASRPPENKGSRAHLKINDIENFNDTGSWRERLRKYLQK
jgi:hypothetical protein